MERMECCLVPFLPAVMVAVEQMEELQQRLTEARAPFASEARPHLAEMAAAVSQLEADRCAVRQQLEVETIENSRLRQGTRGMRERMREEILADVAAVREANQRELDLLQEELRASAQLREHTGTALQELLEENRALYGRREEVKAQREERVEALNATILLRSSSLKHLEETRRKIEELRRSAAATRRENEALLESMALERRAFAEQQEELSKELERLKEEVHTRQGVGRRSRHQLDLINRRKRDCFGHLRTLKSQHAELESEAQRLSSWEARCLQELEEERRRRRELLLQIQEKTAYYESGDLSSAAIRELRGQIAALEGRMEEAGRLRQFHQDLLPQVTKDFEEQQEVERLVQAEHERVLAVLERHLLQQEQLPQQIEGYMNTIVERKREIRGMEEKLKELLEAEATSRRTSKRQMEELHRELEKEKENLAQAKEELTRIAQVLEEAQKEQEAHEAAMRSELSRRRSRYKEVLQEQEELRQLGPEFSDVETLEEHLARSRKEYRREEAALREEVQETAREVERLGRRTRDQQRELEEKEEALTEVAEQWEEAVRRYEELQAQQAELQAQQAELQRRRLLLTEETARLLRSGEVERAELAEQRQHHLLLLRRRAAELMVVELSIYQDGVLLEQLAIENGRLRRANGRMSDGAEAERRRLDGDRQEIRRVGLRVRVLVDALRADHRDVRAAANR